MKSPWPLPRNSGMKSSKRVSFPSRFWRDASRSVRTTSSLSWVIVSSSTFCRESESTPAIVTSISQSMSHQNVSFIILPMAILILFQTRKSWFKKICRLWSSRKSVFPVSVLFVFISSSQYNWYLSSTNFSTKNPENLSKSCIHLRDNTRLSSRGSELESLHRRRPNRMSESLFERAAVHLSIGTVRAN